MKNALEGINSRLEDVKNQSAIWKTGVVKKLLQQNSTKKKIF